MDCMYVCMYVTCCNLLYSSLRSSLDLTLTYPRLDCMAHVRPSSVIGERHVQSRERGASGDPALSENYCHCKKTG